MLSRDDATALVAGSRLFDERWYAEVSGRAFASRTEAAGAWVDAPGQDSPHPLVEPLWLFPGGAWRGQAPDPLSFYLARVAAGRRPPRSPHPLYDVDALGPLEDWLVDHDPAELLSRPAERDTAGATAIVEVPADDVRRAVRWVRHLHRTAPQTVVVLESPRRDVVRVLESVAADLPRVLVGGVGSAAARGTSGPAPRVTIDPGLEPPRWPWLTPLLAALERPGVGAAQPVVLDTDFLVAGPVLVGHPVSALERLDGVALPGRFAGVEARAAEAGVADPGSGRVTGGERVLVTDAWVVGDPAQLAGPLAPDGPDWSALDRLARTAGPGPSADPTAGPAAGPTVASRASSGTVARTESLRWSIDIAAGAAPIGRRWGDWHFARSLADALTRLGQWVEIDHPETRGRATRAETDVVLTLRGLERVAPAVGAVNLLWVISHPAEVTAAELAGFDESFAASTTWAARHGATALLQCTDATRFHPGVAGVGESGADVAGPGGSAARRAGAGADGHGVLFVGNPRGGMRPVVAAARAAGVDVTVIGTGWAEHGVHAAADRIANADLPAAYAAAGVVLGDHHADMAAEGFVSNRVFDVLAVGGRLLSDPVAGLHDLLADLLADLGAPLGAGVGGDLIPTWRTPADLARLTAAADGTWPDRATRLTVAERVVARHSFDARAATLLDRALHHTRSRAPRS